MRKFFTARQLTKTLIIAASSVATAIPALADDTEVFGAILAGQKKPNILFVLDYSASMKRDVEGNETNVEADKKISILKEAVTDILQNNSGKINAGIGSLYNNKPSGVRWPISDLEADANSIDPAIPAGQYTVADVIERQLHRTNANNATATVGGLAEAAAYFRGDDVLHNDSNLSEPLRHKPDTWDNTLVREGLQGGYSGGRSEAAMPFSYTPNDAYQFVGNGNSYAWCTDRVGNLQCAGKAPYDCKVHEASTIVTEATPDTPASTREIAERTVCKYPVDESWTTPKYVSPLTQSCQANFIVLISDGKPTRLEDTQTLRTVLGETDAGGNPNNCEDLSQTIFTGGSDDAKDGNCGPEILRYLATTDINPDIKNSSVSTYTVGFSLDGPGADYLDRLAQEGSGAFYEASKPAELADALANVLDSILAGSQNFAELSIDIDPTTFSHDNKSYFSLFSPSSKNSWQGNLKGFFIEGNGLVDINGNPATFDDGNGIQFASTSQSFWSSTPDGNNTMFGGASETITSMPDGPNNRKMYTYLGGNRNLALSNQAELSSTNNSIQVPAEALDWLANAPMGDPLHTKPVVLNYDNGTPIKRVVYTMTNQGFLHAFDATYPDAPSTPGDTQGGEELFAFMPEELLPNIVKLHKPVQTDGHVYGLDGGITRWHDDDNYNGVVDNNEEVLLIFGMRRGGDSYYALNVSDPQNPEFKWQLSPNDIGFEKMAQSWSRPALISVDTGAAEPQRVLMFGGGYDADAVDGATSRQQGAKGNAVYMVDKDKNEIMTITHPEMTYSIPSDITAIDSNNDRIVDRVYFGDLGGQVWRADFTDVSSGQYTLKKLADLDDGTYQPLYYPPSISKNKERGGENFMAVSIGSGDRTQPLSDLTSNKFYMIKDYDVDQGPVTPGRPLITSTDLYDATENDIGSADPNKRKDAETKLAGKQGWLVKLNTGEKSLSQVVTYEGKFLATTFQPDIALDENGDADLCSFAMVGRLYIMDILDARPVEINADGSETRADLDKGKRVTTLNGTTIPSKPVLNYQPGSSMVKIFVDKEAVAAINKQLHTVFWHAK